MDVDPGGLSVVLTWNGDIGVKQYYYYTKTEAAKLYKEEAWTKQGQFVNQSRV